MPWSEGLTAQAPTSEHLIRPILDVVNGVRPVFSKVLGGAHLTSDWQQATGDAESIPIATIGALSRLVWRHLPVALESAHKTDVESTMLTTKAVVSRWQNPERKAEGKIKGRVTGLLSIGKGKRKYGLREGSSELRSRPKLESIEEKVSYG